MQPMEGPSVHSRCLAFIPFKFWEEGPSGWMTDGWIGSLQPKIKIKLDF
jgi:hypothetical protein